MSIIHIAAICYVAGAAISVAFGASAIPKGQWDAGMDDDAGKASATSQGNLPGADYEGARKIYPTSPSPNTMVFKGPR